MSKIETKIFGLDRDLALNLLNQCAHDKGIDVPEQTFNGQLSVTYYQNKDLPVIRLRKEEQIGKGARNILTVKCSEFSFHPNIRQCTEENIVIIDLAQADRFIRLLGYELEYSIIKHRETWIYNGARLGFDKTEGGTEWLKIEVGDRKHLVEVIEDLGYTLDECSDKTTKELMV